MSLIIHPVTYSVLLFSHERTEILCAAHLTRIVEPKVGKKFFEKKLDREITNPPKKERKEKKKMQLKKWKLKIVPLVQL